MNKVTVKALVALAAVAAWGTASATTLYLNQVGLRAGSGTYYANNNPSGFTLIMDGSDGYSAASTATWDWTGGVLTQTGGFLQYNQHPGSPSVVLSDHVTGLVLDTNTLSTTAATYMCIEGNFGTGTGANSCANTSYGPGFDDESSVAYNVGGNAACEQRTIGGDDTAGSGGIYRGLRNWNGTGAPCGGTTDGNNTGRGALDMVYVVQNNLGSGGTLILANWNASLADPSIGGAPLAACLNPGSAGAADPTGICRRAHWLVFSQTVPVPAAVWLFGSALGVLGVVRRRMKA